MADLTVFRVGEAVQNIIDVEASGSAGREVEYFLDDGIQDELRTEGFVDLMQERDRVS